LGQGADINELSGDDQPMKGMTALAFASLRNHVDVVNLLLQRGADPMICHGGGGNMGWTALMFASWKGHHDVVKQLLSHDAAKSTINYQTKYDGATALFLANREGHVEVVRFLLDAEAQAMVVITPAEKSSVGGGGEDAGGNGDDDMVRIGSQLPLDEAIAKGHTGVVQLLQVGQSDIT